MNTNAGQVFRFAIAAVVAFGGVGLMTPGVAVAVDNHGTGALVPTITMAPSPTSLAPGAPASVDLTQWATPVGDQGSIDSCTGWATAHLMGWYANHAGGPVNDFAPLYVYSQTNLGRNATPQTDSGAHPTDALDVATKGVDTVVNYAHSATDWQTPPTAAELSAGAQFHLTGHTTLFSLPGGNAGVAGMTQIQNELASGTPVAIALPVRPGFDSLSPTNTLDTDITGTIRGYHEVLALGYNADGLLVQNQWGTGWGSAGYGRIGWNVVQQDLVEADVATGYAVSPTPSAASVSDVNGDNLADIVAVRSDGTLWEYANHGSALPYSSGVQIGSSWAGFKQVAVADVNHDGYADIVAVDANGALRQYLNSGTSAPYSSWTPIGSGWGGFTRFAVADVNHDGYADIVAVDGSGSLWQYLNSGTSAPYSTGTRIGSGWGGFTSFAAADLNHDGYADIVAVDGNGTLREYLNSGGSAPYSTGTVIGSGWASFTQLNVMDVDGDGYADIVAVNSAGALVEYRNSRTAQPYSSGVQVGSGWSGFSFVR